MLCFLCTKETSRDQCNLLLIQDFQGALSSSMANYLVNFSPSSIKYSTFIVEYKKPMLKSQI